jgi:hypothetical protein
MSTNESRIASFISLVTFIAMHSRNRSLIAVFLLVASTACQAVAADARPATSNKPFIERVRPDDYFDVEKVFPEPFSSTCELVVLRTAASKPVSALAIKRPPASEDYSLTVHIASRDAPEGWLKISEPLDATLGQQVLRAFELKLHRQVALSNFKRTMSKTDSDLWIFQRLADNKVVAALIAMEVTLGNPSATSFIDGFLGSLEGLIGKEGDERVSQLQKIDRAATEIILAEDR